MDVVTLLSAMGSNQVTKGGNLSTVNAAANTATGSDWGTGPRAGWDLTSGGYITTQLNTFERVSLSKVSSALGGLEKTAASSVLADLKKIF